MIVIGQGVIGASDPIVYVITQFVVARIGGVAHLEAEHSGADEIYPFDHLSEFGGG